MDTDTTDLDQPDLYINRELSLLEFNRRVLEQAKDKHVPLLERLKFLGISSTNLDEFFEIRVSGLKQQVEAGAVQAGRDNMSAMELLKHVSVLTHDLVAEQYRVLNDELIPMLATEGIHFLRRNEWNEAQKTWINAFFKQELRPILTPIGLDSAHPFPRILNKSLNFIVVLSGKDAFGRRGGLAVVPAPRALPRVVRLPDEVALNDYDFVFLSSIIHANIDSLFPGMKVRGCYQFRVTRNSDLFVDEEEINDLLQAVEGELSSRRYGDEVRLEVADNCPEYLYKELLKRFALNLDDLYQVQGPVNLNRLFNVYEVVDRPDLKFPSFTPSMPERLRTEQNIFNSIRQGDILLHHPFDSFLPVIDLVAQAASDPDVLAIKQTLYRTGSRSVLVDHLLKAAQNGKEVTVVIELRARFDEEANIGLAERLQEAGAHVVYGVVGYKTHAKMLLVIRREKGKLRNYVHLGTGNYHARTARLYTDYGLLTCDRNLSEDVSNVFQQLTSLGWESKLKSILLAPFTMHDTIINNIEREIENKKKGLNARLIAKFNALVEPRVIKALYRASRAGVEIDLIIRGICCLRPGIKNISENIRVRSIIGRFLEHTRVYYFENNGKVEIYASSADWMDRNFFRRVEVAFPIRDKNLRKRIIDDLELYLADNTLAWSLQSDGSYARVEKTEDDASHDVQTELLTLASPR